MGERDVEGADSSRRSSTCCAWTCLGVGNLLACSVICAGAWVGWQLGFTLTVFYFFITAALAVNLQKQRSCLQIVNLLWVLVCLQVLCLGTWLGICAIGQWQGLLQQSDKVADMWDFPDAMQAWADDSSMATGIGHHVFGSQHVFFTALEDAQRLLMRADAAPSQATAVVAPGMLDAHSFAEFKGDLYFFARPNATAAADEAGESLWAIRSSDASNAVLVQRFDVGFQLRRMFLTSKRFFFKVYSSCGAFKSETFYQSDGMTNGTLDMNSGALYDGFVKGCAGVASGVEMRPPSDRLLGVLFLGVIPQTCLACFLLTWMRVPGVILNIYGGIYACGLLIWLLISDNLAKMLFWFQVSLPAYALTTSVAATMLQVVWGDLPFPWLQDLASWAAAVTGLGLFGATHIALNIPFSTDSWQWVLYGLVPVAEIVMGLLMQRQVPTALGGVALLVLSYKVAFGMVDTMQLGIRSDLKLTLQLGILGLLGVFVLLAGIFYARHEWKLEALALGVFGKTRRAQPVGRPRPRAWAVAPEAPAPHLMEKQPDDSDSDEDEVKQFNLISQMPFQELLKLHSATFSQLAGGKAPVAAPKAANEYPSVEDEEDC